MGEKSRPRSSPFSLLPAHQNADRPPIPPGLDLLTLVEAVEFPDAERDFGCPGTGRRPFGDRANGTEAGGVLALVGVLVPDRMDLPLSVLAPLDGGTSTGTDSCAAVAFARSFGVWLPLLDTLSAPAAAARLKAAFDAGLRRDGLPAGASPVAVAGGFPEDDPQPTRVLPSPASRPK